MKDEIYEAIENLQSVLREYAPKNAIKCEIFINASGSEWKIHTKNPEILKNSKISMRNLSGEFIK